MNQSRPSWKQRLFRTKTIEQIARDVEQGGGLDGHGSGLKRTLGVWDLTSFGIAAIIGAGIFSTVGNAAFQGGPAVVFLFVFTAIACGFSAFCYAEFASAIPIAGSAYTYAYASFGEILAWIIGWDLLVEYAIGNIAVAISWGDYFVGVLTNLGVKVPAFFTTDYLSASRAFDQLSPMVAQGQTMDQIAKGGMDPSIIKSYLAWVDAPRPFHFPIICNLPALLITLIISWVVYIGITESKRTSNILVAIKIAVVLMVIAIGAFYIHPSNWVPFAPNGAGGVLKGVSAVFFAYIGFDAISTTAEECKNPQRDLPLGMIYSLVICTVLYIGVSLVLTGMVSYKKLEVGDPLAYVFGPEGVNLPWISMVISVSAVIALSTVILVFQLGQPRIWMAMSRDGLLPPIFAAIHPKYKTPWFSTIVAGFLVAIPSLFMNLTEVTDLTSIGTLFAFVLVCGGVLRLGPESQKHRKFKTPYLNSKWIFPAILLIAALAVWHFNADSVQQYFSMTDLARPEAHGWDVFQHKIPLGVFGVAMIILGYLCFAKNLSLIPVLGLSSCAYLMTELGITNWIRFGVWLLIGFFVYFFYGAKHSRLNTVRS